jgi:molybdopterin/thiamine biosynthesis adenylyltransferase
MHDNLAKKLTPQTSGTGEPKPVFFDLNSNEEQAKLESLLEEHPHTRVIDTYDTQLLEAFVLDNPALHINPPERDRQFKDHRDQHYGQKEAWQAGKWVYLPWRHALLHVLEDSEYQKVRTGRNRNLITAPEQDKYYHSTIGIGGLSVGNSIALAIVLTGGGKHMKLADPDTLELTNLNRIRGSITDLTEPKVYMTARQIYELDPYADLTLYTEGITEENIEEFFEGLDIVLDEIDNLGIKVRIRQHAKKNRIPVVMAADNGEGGILDVERHDKEDDIPYFHGRAGKDIEDRVLNQKLPLPLIGKIICEELIGYDITDTRMQQSVLQIGQEIPTWPQLGGAALLNGVAVAAIVRRILTGQPAVNNRADLRLSAWVDPYYNDPEQAEQRRRDTEKFGKAYDANIEAFLKSIGG